MSQFQKSRFLITVCLLVFADSAYGQSLALPRVSSGAETWMRVHVYNDAGLSQRDLNLAESVATEIFRDKKVEVAWYNCGPSNPTNDAPRCAESLGLNTFELRICRSCTSSLSARGREVGGYAAGRTATVSSLWAAQFEQTRYVCSTKVLGRAMVHELGHLLLGPNHSPVGIMKANWMPEDLNPAKLGMLMFTSEQGELIRSILKLQGSANSETVASAKSSIQGDLPSANK